MPIGAKWKKEHSKKIKAQKARFAKHEKRKAALKKRIKKLAKRKTPSDKWQDGHFEKLANQAGRLGCEHAELCGGSPKYNKPPYKDLSPGPWLRFRPFKSKATYRLKTAVHNIVVNESHAAFGSEFVRIECQCCDDDPTGVFERISANMGAYPPTAKSMGKKSLVGDKKKKFDGWLVATPYFPIEYGEPSTENCVPVFYPPEQKFDNFIGFTCLGILSEGDFFGPLGKISDAAARTKARNPEISIYEDRFYDAGQSIRRFQSDYGVKAVKDALKKGKASPLPHECIVECIEKEFKKVGFKGFGE